jgi:hypothetical protein
MIVNTKVQAAYTPLMTCCAARRREALTEWKHVDAANKNKINGRRM